MDVTAKLPLYLNYLGEDIRYFDLASIRDSINYVLFNKVPRIDRIVKTRMGTFITRKGTTDFMFTNFAYEIKVKQFINDHAKAYDVYVDIGSCIGDYSIWLAKQGFKVFAIEPDPENFASLSKNIKLNHLESRITTLNFGLADEAGILPFSNNLSNKGASRILQNEEDEEHIKVSVHPWDTVVQKLSIKPVDKILLKLDVEGMEEKVIKGMMQFLTNQKNVILILEIKMGDTENMKKLLTQTGSYSFYEIDEHNMGAIKIS